MEKSIQTLEAFDAEAAHLASSLAPNGQGATLVTLSGELGVGKTAFVKAIARTFGVDEVVTSPTFVLEKIYLLPEDRPFKRLIHIDAYRLEKGVDLAPLGFDELMKDSGNLILLEWPERVRDALPSPAKRVSFTAHHNGSRMISYD
jgi:tRNA threonylcarbamoyladenosine biosynthesis protein TsaE